MFCSKCGSSVNEGSMFCPECGAKVISAQPDNQQAQVQPQPQPVAVEQGAVYTAVPGKKGMSTGAAVAIGIGIGLVIVAIAAACVFFLI